MTDTPKSKKQGSISQHKRFVEAARELGCDEDEGRFIENLKKVASAPPAPKPKAKPGKAEDR